ncbi:MAG: AAA family ATPase, partial [Pyramidobacter sp.]|nr:AAA family ATPase [Pyramidobacter sp.]
MKKFSEVVKEDEERMNRIVSPVPDIPFDDGAGLNEDQEEALKTLQSGADCFLTGSAGSGKSFVLCRFIAERCERSVLVTAPTKIAAHHLGGKTLHSVFSVPYEE